MPSPPINTDGDLLSMVLASTDPIAIVEAKSILDIFAKDRKPDILTQNTNSEKTKIVDTNTLTKTSQSEISHSFIIMFLQE